MYSDDHEPPHIHIIYGGKVSRIGLEEEVIENFFPPSKYKLLIKWMRLHKDELLMNWERRKHGQKIIKIKPWS